MGRILGAGVSVGARGRADCLLGAGHLQGLKLSAVAQTVLPYPTLSEAGKRAAVSYYAGLTKNRLVRGVIAFLKLWG